MPAWPTRRGEIAPDERLAAGEMHLQHAERRRLAQAPAARSRCRVRPRRARAPAGLSNRGNAAGSDGSTRRAAPRAARPRGRPGAVIRAAPFCRRGPAASAARRRRPPRASASYSRLNASMIASASRIPSTSRSTATACSSGNNSRSGASTTQACRTSSKRNFACGAKRRTEPPRRLSGRALMTGLFRDKSAGRDQSRLDISEIERVELHPQHVAFEAQGIEHLRLLFRRVGVLLDVREGESDVGRRLGQPRREIGESVAADEVVILQHAGDALGDDLRREHLGQARGHRLQQRAVAHEIDISIDGEPGRRQAAPRWRSHSRGRARVLRSVSASARCRRYSRRRRHGRECGGAIRAAAPGSAVARRDRRPWPGSAPGSSSGSAPRPGAGRGRACRRASDDETDGDCDSARRRSRAVRLRAGPGRQQGVAHSLTSIPS